MTARLFTAALIGALTIGTAYAQGSETPAAPAPAPDKKICRSIIPTGSIMGKRICLTKAEWQQFNDINQANAEAGLSKRIGTQPRELEKN